MTTVHVKESQKPFKSPNWRYYSLRIRAKQKEFVSALGVVRQGISKRLHAWGMIQKQGTWIPYDLRAGHIDCRLFFVCEQLFQ